MLLIGKFFGKHKFSEISPKKSIEGCIAGIFGTVIFFIIYSACLNNMNIKDFEKTSDEISDVAQIEVIEELNEEIEEARNKNVVPVTDSEMHEQLKKWFYTNYPLLIVLGIVASVISQIGDFSASGIKRYAGIKDFSNLMPGHGGMLDRFDSILFIAPIMYYTFFIIERL